MSDARKFKFISPGIFLKEIDNSQLPAAQTEVGPVIIGRAQKGPAMRPYTVESFSDFVNVFGEPVAGGSGGDYFRQGNIAGPTYGAYAAQAYLDAAVGPITYVRMLGEQHPDKTTGGEAGWTTTLDFEGGQTAPQESLAYQANGGAYGLFVLPSSSVASASVGSGSLAAIWYMDSGSTVNLSGNARFDLQLGISSAPVAASGSAILLQSDSTLNFTAEILDSLGGVAHKTSFNFDRNSDKYIRKVFNTNPTLTNSTITDTSVLKKGESTYWLGETFDSYLFEKLNTTSGTHFGIILGIGSGSGLQTAAGGNAPAWQERQFSFQSAESGWIFSQDLGTSPTNYDATQMTKLFKFIARDAGEHAHRFKISIEDIKASTNDFDKYGTFSVVIRKASDSDVKPVIVERFSQSNLNPSSPSYVKKKIGDRYVEWDYEDARMREYGEYINQSEIIRIDMNPDIGGADERLLPFGGFGPIRPFGVTLISGSGGAVAGESGIIPIAGNSGVSTIAMDSYAGRHYSFVVGSGSIAGTFAAGTSGFTGRGNGGGFGDKAQSGFASSVAGSGDYPFTGSVFFPAPLTRLSASDHGSASPKDAYFGLQTNLWSSARSSTAYDDGYTDYLRGIPNADSPTGVAKDTISGAPDGLEYSWIFTLDDIVVPSGKTNDAYWFSGSRNGHRMDGATTAGDSVTSASYSAVLDSGFDKFTIPLYGGSDGFNIKDKDPFADYRLTPSGTSATVKNSAVYNTVKKSIDSLKDPEFVEMNMVALPGVVNENLTGHAINVCEERGDALAVIDLRGVYQPFTENANDFKSRVTATSLDGAVTALRDRSINSSYGCAYYPWVQIQDTITGQSLWAPPSVAAVGTLASSERKSEVWFAPAGFNRGGLTDGSAGLPVTAVTEKLSSKDRDKLYGANINPIASFPSEGIVVFGQKTLQVTPSALDRINVRRLMIFIKKEVSRIAASILFDQNVSVTWQRFTGQVEPLLSSVKVRLGLTDFKVILDETTTTPDLIDRNILYAKIFLKPARAIEFIAIDFNITRTGAAFED